MGVAEPRQQRAEVNHRAAQAAQIGDDEPFGVAADDALEDIAQPGAFADPARS